MQAEKRGMHAISLTCEIGTITASTPRTAACPWSKQWLRNRCLTWCTLNQLFFAQSSAEFPAMKTYRTIQIKTDKWWKNTQKCRIVCILTFFHWWLFTVLLAFYVLCSVISGFNMLTLGELCLFVCVSVCMSLCVCLCFC